jgi:hypothetical protein
MNSYLLFLIVVKYILGLFRKERKMPKKEFPLLEFVGLWLVVLFGFLATTEFPFEYRVLLMVSGTVGIVLFGVYYNNRYIKPKTSHPATGNKTVEKEKELLKSSSTSDLRYNSIAVVIWIIDGILFGYFGVYNWQYVEVEGLPVLTYTDAWCVLFLALAIISVLITIMLLRRVISHYK